MTTIENAGQLRGAVLDRYDKLSPRLKDIARFLLDDPHSMGVETLAVISDRVRVPPSAIVRFAKTFGFEGAGPMQRLLKDGLLAMKSESAYHQRAREFSEGSTENPTPSTFQLLKEFSASSSMSLDHLQESVNEADLDEALRLLKMADVVHVAGYRRSFPVAAYLTYSLQQGGKRTILADGVGGFAHQPASQFRPGDLLIAISFRPYAGETLNLIKAAKEHGAAILALTDTLVSPVAKQATCVLQVRDSEVRGFRNLAASMCLAQALAIALAFQSSVSPAID